jgi:hypothetical protein
MMNFRAVLFIFCVCLLTIPSTVIIVNAPALACGGMVDGPNGPEAENPCPPGQNNNSGGTYVNPDRFVALAISNKTLAFGYSWNASSRAQAEQLAMANCARTSTVADCHVETWAVNACMAIAKSLPDMQYGDAWDAIRAQAKQKALNQCKNVYKGRSCKVVYQVCAHDPV